MRKEHPVASGDAHEIDVEGPVPGLVGHDLGRSQSDHTDVVHHHLEMAELLEARFAECDEVPLFGHIDLHGHRPAAGAGDLCGDGLRTLLGEIAHGHRCPSLGEGQGRCPTDAAPSSGDDDGRAIEVQWSRHAIATALVWRNSNRPSSPPSRPKPEMPMPPNGNSAPTTGEAPLT